MSFEFVQDNQPLKVTHRATIPDYAAQALSPDRFWRAIPAWQGVSDETFGDPRWQLRNSIKSIQDVFRLLQGQLTDSIIQDFEEGQRRAPMNIRMTPYIFARINWKVPETDPVRRQFLPLASEHQPDHPCHARDSLGEDKDRVTPHLTHRYPDKALFLPITICPVYCYYCTRSRVVGGSTPSRPKKSYGAKENTWDDTFAYLRAHTEVEDVVVSGGDASMLKASQLEHIGLNLLKIPSIRRIRFASKGLSILPMQITRDNAWFTSLKTVHAYGKERMKEVCLHTHFETPEEITWWTWEAMRNLVDAGITVRNQSVILRGVNDTYDRMHYLIKLLSLLRIQPYYVYAHDMVPGCEHLRTSILQAQQLSKELLGTTAGFNLPKFVCDAPAGGGKREISSYEAYDTTYGITSWTAPKVKTGRVFYYYDPVDLLGSQGKAFWSDFQVNPEGLKPTLDGILSRYKAQQ
jgi:lysine 2,3-aminomutase